jgi:hypothetical protein
MRGHRVAEDLTGKVFNRLTVLHRFDAEPNRCVRWLTVCVCGKQVVARTQSLKTGKTKSCGCWRADSRKLAPGICSRNHLLATYKAAAKRRGHEWHLADQEFFSLTQQPCHYCGEPPAERQDSKRYNGSYVCNGIDRRDNAKGYAFENCLPACKDCNRMKGTMPYDDFIAFLTKAGNFQLKKQNTASLSRGAYAV